MIDLEYLEKCVVLVYFNRKVIVGTGFLVLPDGHVLTCYHSFRDNDINLNSNDTSFIHILYENDLLKCEYSYAFSNLEKDVVVLKIEERKEKFPFLPLGDCKIDNKIYSWSFQDNEYFRGYPIYGEVAGFTKRKKDGIELDCILIKETNIEAGCSGAPLYDKKCKCVDGIINEKKHNRNEAYAIKISEVYEKWGFLEEENKKKSEYYHKDKAKQNLVKEISELYRISNWDFDTKSSLADIIISKIPPAGTGKIKFTILIWCIFTDQEKVNSSQVEEIAKIFRTAKSKNVAYHGIIISNKSFKEEAFEIVANDELELNTKKDVIRNLINFDKYISKVIKTYEDYQEETLSKYYEDLTLLAKNEVEIKTMKDFFEKWLENNNVNSNIVILGEFGTGKTSFCLKFAHDLAQQYKQDNTGIRIPIVINLKDYRKETDIKSVIINTLVKNNVEIPDYEIFKEMNKMGLFVLIYDGFDEMATKANESTISHNLHQIYRTINSKNKVILTSRIEYFKSAKKLTSKFVHAHFSQKPSLDLYHLKEFEDTNIRSLLQKRVGSEWERYYNKIISTDSLKELAYRPLFLDKIIFTLPDIIDIANPNIAEIYKVYFVDYLEKLYGDDRTILPMELAQNVLIRIAEKMHLKRSNSIEIEDIEDIVNDNLMKDLAREKIGFYDCIDTVISKTFLRGSEEHGYTFSHESFQYYFRAKCLFDAIENNKIDLFDVKFIGAETILFIRDMLQITQKDTLMKWLNKDNINIRKYAVILLGFIKENRGGDSNIRLEPRMDNAIIVMLLDIIKEYECHNDYERVHIVKHAKLSLSILGLDKYKQELIIILEGDSDYTHRWYALLGIHSLIMNNKNTIRDFKSILIRISKNNVEIPEIRRLADKILEFLDEERGH